MTQRDLNLEGFAYVVLGSNLTECIIGAGLAIAGDKCCHLDQSDRYGGHLTSFNLEHFFKYVDNKIAKTCSREDHCSDFAVLKPFDLSSHASETDFKKFSRPCNIDLAPKLIFSKSTSVDMLIKSGTSHYLEFQNVPRNFFYSKDKFVEIPFSKSEIFVSQSLSLKEKRQLVRVIGFCLQGYDLIAGKELTSKIINSTHAYEKLDTTLTKDEITLLIDYKDQPIPNFLAKLGVETHLENVLYFAIGAFDES